MRVSQEHFQKAYGRAWKRWALVLAAPFAVLFIDTWLNIENRNQDYDLGRLKEARNTLQAELTEIQVARAGLESLDKLETQALALALAEPDPQQIVTVTYDGSLQDFMRGPEELVLARQEAAEALDAPVNQPGVPAVVAVLSNVGRRAAAAFEERIAQVRGKAAAEGALAPQPEAPAVVQGLTALSVAAANELQEARPTLAANRAPRQGRPQHEQHDSGDLDASVESLLGSL